MLIEVRPPVAGDDGRLAVATPFQIQTLDPDMWRFQRVDQHAVYDCELFLLWFIGDPDGEFFAPSGLIRLGSSTFRFHSVGRHS